MATRTSRCDAATDVSLAASCGTQINTQAQLDGDVAEEIFHHRL
jgi:hypothetical protein